MKLFILKGLPGSGKSTWAKAELERRKGQLKRINRDDLRAMIDNGKWSQANEKVIRQVEILLTEIFLNQKFDVLVDDTNLSPSAMQMWLDKANQWNIIPDIIDFTDVPIEECIKRDQKRPNYVGEKVIRKMAREHLQKKKLLQDATLPHAVITDIDGTLAVFDGLRSPYATELCEGDLVNESVRLVLNSISEPRRVILVSGRSEDYRAHTERWLKCNEIDYLHLYMRKSGDTKNDTLVKEEIFNEHIRSKYYIDYVLDDRNRIVDYWRSEGLVCFQVNYGDF